MLLGMTTARQGGRERRRRCGGKRRGGLGQAPGHVLIGGGELYDAHRMASMEMDGGKMVRTGVTSKGGRKVGVGLDVAGPLQKKNLIWGKPWDITSYHLNMHISSCQAKVSIQN